jgi:hypothetical protein
LAIEILNKLQYQYEPGEVAITASTGIAAYIIGGVTIHR